MAVPTPMARRASRCAITVRAPRRVPRRKPRAEWLALQPGAHEGYVDWDRAEAIRTMVSENVPTAGTRGAPKHGCGAVVGPAAMPSLRAQAHRSVHRGQGPDPSLCLHSRKARSAASRIASHSAACAWTTPSRRHCSPSYSLPRCKPHGLPRRRATVRRDEAREAMIRDLEAARYAADRAFRQYDAADPENRFVAGELEARWNRALTRRGRVRAPHRRS